MPPNVFVFRLCVRYVPHIVKSHVITTGIQAELEVAMAMPIDSARAPTRLLQRNDHVL